MKRRANADGAVEGYFAAQGVRQETADGQPEAGAAIFSGNLDRALRVG